MVGLDTFHKLGYTGKNVTIGLFDGGFYKADTVHAFDSLWQQGRIKGYWDFITEDTSIFGNTTVMANMFCLLLEPTGQTR